MAGYPANTPATSAALLLDARANNEDWAMEQRDRTWRVIETVQAVAAEVDRTPAQGGAALDTPTAGDDRPNHRCPHPGAADGQPQGDRLALLTRKLIWLLIRGCGRAAAVPLRVVMAAAIRTASGLILRGRHD